MGLLGFLGYVLIGVGPGAAIFKEFIAPSPFIVLLSVASAFFWICVLLLNAIVWKPFEGLLSTNVEYIAPLFTFLLIEEALRPLVWKQTNRLFIDLEKQALRLRHPRLNALEKLRLNLGVGFGQGIAHSALLFLSTVNLSAGGGTYYSAQCTKMPYFLVVAISSSTFLVVLSFAMVLYNVVSAKTSILYRLIPAGFHAICCTVSLISLLKEGCILSSIINPCIALSAIWYTSKMATSHVGANRAEYYLQ